ncbi:hypothetical protein [Burkholderia sp. B21-005]|uniref:hypothetical protein n=1 Tax=Burkholderia sp. B21-005 TaxID=2890406 RepID=UPI001E4D9678|nr:hypothetical protein [Burkholderia sp. B21-005]UEP45641.1 hypothetical protein LMA02_23305 [Burkholderia sp. B21-005]
MQKYDFTAPASGAPQAVNAPGRYLKYVTGNAGGNDAGLIVTPGSKPGTKILLYPGQAITLPDDGTAGPNGWTIANAVGAAQIAGALVIGNGRIDDNTLQGVVQVVDGGKSRTLTNAAFMGSVVVNATAAICGRAQLWNPVGSGIRAVVKEVSAFAGATAIAVAYQWNSAALANDAGAGASKLAGGAGGACHLRWDATQGAGNPAPTMVSLNIAANGNGIYEMNEPIILPPGYGLIAWNDVVNSQFGSQFEWFEEPNV